MRVLHAYNLHRGGGGSDAATKATVRIATERGVTVGAFARDSRLISPGIRGKAHAFFGGIYARSAVNEFSRTLEEFAPDVVHVHELYPMISPWIMPRCTKAGVPVVMNVYDYRLSCPVATHYNNGVCEKCSGGHEYWAVLKNCRSSLAESVAFAARSTAARLFDLYTGHVARFIVLTPFMQRWLSQEIGVSEDRISISPCSVAIPDTGVDDPSQGEYIGFAGRFVPEKGVEVLLEASRLAKVPVRMAGNAPEHPAVRAGDDVSFVMTNSPAELADFYRRCRALVVPSIWSEAFGIVAAEAMSHGVPVIASRIGGLPDVVQHNATGLLFEAGNAADLATQLRRIWDDADLCRRLGAAARQRVSQRCSEDAYFDRLMNVYQSVASTRLIAEEDAEIAEMPSV